MPLFAQTKKVDVIRETLSSMRSAVVRRQKSSSTLLPDADDSFARFDSQLAIRFVQLTAYAAKDVNSCYQANEAEWRALAKSLKHHISYGDGITNLTDYDFDS